MDPDAVYSNMSDFPGTMTGVKRNSPKGKSENLYQNLRLEPTGVHAASPAAAPESQSAEGQLRKECLCKKTSLLFICLWIVTLISLIAILGLYFKQCSALRSELKEQQRNSSAHITELEKQLGEKEQELSQLWSRYNSGICSCNDTNNTVRGLFVELSRKSGAVIKPVWEWIRVAAVHVTADPDTANPFLRLYNDGKQVGCGDTWQNLPDTPKRFDTVPSVLGKEGFSSGRFYYEVQVGEKNGWALGVAEESINRMGDVILTTRNGFWTVWLSNGTDFKALDDPLAPLPLREKPRTVGVYVDYEEGQVSFYNVEARSHIYSFTGYNFTEKLYPYLSPFNTDNGKNTAPLIISPVNHIALI
ncbi:hypothetical protein AGOR_G00161090 [Albula goreensis]|uniref:B30.2/SPRY domain-containing protein n=1 Tax=Albula goreensis TaxID=1534307 RepID=A0A8T3D928_9TELE|nr:hypothetical protein AGOR_G00161090 [Albula goreensis]